MTMPRPAETAETSLTRELLHAARYYLGGRRGMLILAGMALLPGLALNWSWLVAEGIAAILISVLPCVAMRALGLCMNRAMGKSCSTDAITSKPTATATKAAPTVRVATPEVSPDRPNGQLPSGSVGAPASNLVFQPLKERSTSDA